MLHDIVAWQGIEPGGCIQQTKVEIGFAPGAPWFCFAPQSMQRLLVLCTETNK